MLASQLEDLDMPLKKGKSQKTISSNIRTLVDDYSKSGRIGTSKPPNKKAAVKQAVAIALRQAGKPKKFAAGGSINEFTNYLVEPGVSYEQQFAKEMKAKARAKADKERESESESTGVYDPEKPRLREIERVAPQTNYPSQPEETAQQVRKTRPRMKFVPEEIDVTKPPKMDRANLRRGGKVSSKKGRKK